MAYVRANVIGLDFGSDTMKVALVAPGAPLEIVTNFQSKRKTPTAVSFFERDGRAFGDDALPHMGKAPEKVRLGRCTRRSSPRVPRGWPEPRTCFFR